MTTRATRASDSTPTDGLAAGDAVRVDVYRLLARLLAAPPDALLLKALGEMASEENGEGLTSALAELRAAARAARPDALDDEFHALFIGLGRGELMPYASWYMTGFLMSRPLAALRRDLASLGIERLAGVQEPEDHAAALCEAMSLVIGDAEEIPPEAQQRFFEAHVGPWMNRFFADMRRAHAARFYAAVGTLGEGFMQLETQYLEH